MRLCAPLLVTFLASTAHAGNTWYVDVNAVPPGNGSAATPFTAIQQAIEQATTVNGDAILVLPGVYNEVVDYGPKQLEVRSTAGPLQTRIVSPTMQSAVRVDGPQGGTLAGFHVRTHLIGVSAGSLTIRDCVIERFEPLAIDGSSGVEFSKVLVMDHCTIVGFDNGIAHTVLAFEGPSTVDNTLFFGNLRDVQMSPLSLGGSTLNHSYWRTANAPTWTMSPPSTAASPGLWSVANSDFHLAPLSVCIDAGNPASPLDPDGSIADIGAIPYDATYAATPTVYCTPKINSKGCAPSVSSSGTASLSGPDDFVLTTTSLLNKKNGSYIWSYAPKATPFAGGTLCIKLPLVRGTQLNTGGNPTGLDCSGSLVWPFTQSYMAQKNVPAGAVIYAQAWARDSGFAAPNNSQLSNAIVFGVAP
ncbi:MAG: hypothetical protein K8S98_09395 [Planctomycetes bacterium]|nr:hypothetical protein [Planctomycetota bacterium]